MNWFEKKENFSLNNKFINTHIAKCIGTKGHYEWKVNELRVNFLPKCRIPSPVIAAL